jgi:chemotaxis protein MotA
MNIYSILSFILAALVFGVGVFMELDNAKTILDIHAILIVFGGTIAVTSISFQMDRVMTMLVVFYHRVIKGKRVKYAHLIEHLMLIAEAYRKNPDSVSGLLKKANDPFLTECIGIMKQEYLTHEELFKLLNLRARTIHNRYMNDAKKFRAIGKFPPAMGLMGAVTGMIGLLQNIGKPGSEETMGPAMAVALVATLYGIALANLVVLPIADNLTDSANEAYLKNTIIIEGLKLIAEKKNRIMFADHLNSFLLPQERISWKKAE